MDMGDFLIIILFCPIFDVESDLKMSFLIFNKWEINCLSLAEVMKRFDHFFTCLGSRGHKLFWYFEFPFFRDDIGACVEKSYESLEVGEAARLLFFSGKSVDQDIKTYAQKVRIYTDNIYNIWYSINSKMEKKTISFFSGLFFKNR